MVNVKELKLGDKLVCTMDYPDGESILNNDIVEIIGVTVNVNEGTIKYIELKDLTFAVKEKYAIRPETVSKFNYYIYESENKLLFAKVKESAIVPTKESENAGYDLYPCFDEDFMFFEYGETKLVPTGIATAMNEGYYMQIQERGSTGSKGIKYGAGVIDSGYRGEIFVPITNLTNKILIISKLPEKETIEKAFAEYKTVPKDVLVYPYSKGIAQGIIHKVHEMAEAEISYEELLRIPSKRGTGALGSSGK